MLIRMTARRFRFEPRNADYVLLRETMMEGPAMRVAALYDIHANLPALEAVLEEVRRAGVDRIVIGGDVLPGPMPRETMAALQAIDLPIDFIRGNGDREVLAQMRGMPSGDIPEQARVAIRWVADQLSPEHERFLSPWPATLRMRIDPPGDVLFCHATPRNDIEMFTRATPDSALVPIFSELDAQLVVCGHTHMQFDRMVGGVRVVNAGSVGMPFGEAGAYWLLLGPGVELRRTTYDLANAANRIRNTAYPQAEEFAERSILHPPSEAEMLQAFAKVELK
jgi:predicted phosphodiesterase